VEKDDDGMNQQTDAGLSAAIEFIWLEADLLDHKLYTDWLLLWDADGKYVVPIDPNETDFENSLNYAYDDAAMRDMRVRRLTSGQSMSASHAAQTLRSVSRFRLLAENGDGCLHIRCAQNLVEYKYDKHRTYAANVTWVLRPHEESFRIVSKIVRLINSTDALSGMTFLP
jgi:3-phenylpropionate/cinnamic acid dioxygenase small subunit